MKSLDYDYSPTAKKSNLLGSQPKMQSPQMSYQYQGHGQPHGQEDFYMAQKGYYQNYPNYSYASQPQK